MRERESRGGAEWCKAAQCNPAAMAEGLSAAASHALRAAVLQLLQLLRVALFLLALPFLASAGFFVAILGRLFLKH